MIAMRLLGLLAALGMAAVASAPDAQLSALHATLVKLHAQNVANSETMGATPELTVAKHQLRDWIETQLASAKDFDQAKALSARINEILSKLGAANSSDDQNLLGSVGDVRIRAEAALVIVTTALGILCQYDESAYAYQNIDGRWKRIWESEQNDYSPKKYMPQFITSVHAWQSWKDGHKDGPPFIMTLGHAWGCASTWHDVYYRIWRIDPSGSKLLVDGSEFAWMRTDTYAKGSIGQDLENDSPIDALIEFSQASIDPGVHNREAVRHYLIEGDHARRVDPVALSPRDFVDEWLTRPWSESAAWSASPDLQTWRRKFDADAAGAYNGPSMHCETPDLWQVAVEPQHEANQLKPEPPVFFLVRWRPPYHFTMVDIAAKPWPHCAQKDPEADQWRTLFNTQDWRW
jgi:hypothetical protein